MKLTNLKAIHLESLPGASTAEEVAQFAALPEFASDTQGPKAITVTHRRLVYRVGRWDSWQGPYWVREERTGIIYRGSLSHIKDMVTMCSRVAKGELKG